MWRDLSMLDRSTLMLRLGIYNPKRVKRLYDDYLSKMELVAEKNYKNWGFDNSDQALIHALNDNTYNYMGYFNDNPNGNIDAEQHWPDTYKTVYHPTFSNESRYSGVVDRNYNPEGKIGGSWGDNGEFIPADWLRLKSHGGPIHIKHPGRLTALKKRTGKTEAELWSTGNKDYRRMINFARLARKWHKHEYGGYVEGLIYDISEGEIEQLIDAGYEIEYI